MSTAQTQPIGESSKSISPRPPAVGRWIINRWADQTFIILTPLMAMPVFFVLISPWVGVNAETVSLIVASFFAAGHHLPGMIRAYGDRDLFERFRWRFILVPPITFAVFFPLYLYHFNAYRVITLIWATWHGLMQVYGFGRIYDVKVGVKSTMAAYWDWLLCVSWFITAQVMAPVRLSTLLELWYSTGGPLLSPQTVQGLQWGCMGFSIAILIGFIVNYTVQSVRGPKPNPNKVFVLASGIGIWWVAFIHVENPVLGLAVADFSHDVQYMAIVWLYNCRRVNSNANVGQLMKFVFRRGMLPLYLGLIASYGAIGLVPGLARNEAVITLFTGILWTSTVLHYYMDGFIWKVRETSTQASLGLNEGKPASGRSQSQVTGIGHLLKWSPLLLFVSWCFATDSDQYSLPLGRTKELSKQYVEQLSTTSSLPADKNEQSWLYARFREIQNIAAAIPTNRPAQTKAAIMLANFGHLEEATAILEKQVANDPDDAESSLLLGGIQLKRGNQDSAFVCFETALRHAKSIDERTRANIGLGEIHLMRKEPDLAKARFDEAIRGNPKLQESLESKRQQRSSRSNQD